ncbi:hypothetical protein TBC1_12232 [Lentimicrobium saccharophilum]|uniref:Acyl-CoA reductase n=1 Tax=Lentimicrobium saccharophilum TaxID=1678841 RepID=A0A0S7C5K4_9BACT|nr:hypothetical protein [Lentimicrobium saccharophilum]GAP44424.1 hypothetical protein TBC1_12232 [Lentimicrobium saccharophilum]
MDQKPIQAGLYKFAEELFFLSGENIRPFHAAQGTARHDDFREQFLSGIRADRWFVDEHIRYALRWLAESMLVTGQVLPAMKPVNKSLPVAFWIKPLSPLEGVGEIILAAFHGYRCLLKTSFSDRKMYEAVFGLLGNYIAGFTERIIYVEDSFPGFSGMIVIGEKNGPVSESYLVRYPLLRFNYNQTAIITGNESDEELCILAEDICIYFGRSARNVKMLKVPQDYDFRSLTEAISAYNWQINYSVYLNHYEYHKASMLLGRVPHLDSGHLLLTANREYSGRIGVLVYEYSHQGPETDNPVAGTAGGVLKSTQTGRCRSFFCNTDEMGIFLEKLKDCM